MTRHFRLTSCGLTGGVLPQVRDVEWLDTGGATCLRERNQPEEFLPIFSCPRKNAVLPAWNQYHRCSFGGYVTFNS